jgi:hypothetical protein
MEFEKWKSFRRKYVLGKNPCGPCSVDRNHENCRPRLDLTLCSCSCPQADSIRGQYFILAQERGVTEHSNSLVLEAVKELCPRFRLTVEKNI